MTEFDDVLLERINSVVQVGDEIATLSNNRPNVIAGIDSDGIWVHTLRSDSLRSGPQFVPAWMIVTAWQYLRQEGSLTNSELVHYLNVKRSAFVIALLAQFPDVVVRSTRPIIIELVVGDHN